MLKSRLELRSPLAYACSIVNISHRMLRAYASTETCRLVCLAGRQGTQGLSRVRCHPTSRDDAEAYPTICPAQHGNYQRCSVQRVMCCALLHSHILTVSSPCSSRTDLHWSRESCCCAGREISERKGWCFSYIDDH